MQNNLQAIAFLSVLAFLGTGFLLGMLGVAAFVSWITRRRPWALGAAAAMFGLAGLYAVALLGLSWMSRERVLVRGQEKYFCEVDCHLAYAILDVQKMPAGGGTHYLIKLRTRFDETTISFHRGNFPLHPNPRRVALVDDHERQFEGAVEAGSGSAPLEQSLRPGESYITNLVFDLPVDARNPRLLLTGTILPTVLLIGHENSFLHQKTSFRLD
jgi:hypothetical protein